MKNDVAYTPSLFQKALAKRSYVKHVQRPYKGSFPSSFADIVLLRVSKSLVRDDSRFSVFVLKISFSVVQFVYL